MDIYHPEDVARARESAKHFAMELGFDDTASEEIAIAASELASNLIKHARGGNLKLAQTAADKRPGLELESSDTGPGMADTDRAMTDGFSMTGSLGYGLGTVNRLMDEFHIQSQPGQGTTIRCKRWLRTDAPPLSPCPLEFGVATRPYPGMEVNGDAFIIKRWDSCALVGVIDGLGHGPFAYLAAETARQYVETHYDQPLDMLFRGVAQTCRATRGVVMALARFDFDIPLDDNILNAKEPLPAKIGIQAAYFKLSFASIGNIEQRVLSRLKLNFNIRRGVLGGSAPTVAVTEHPWDTASILVLHSDGLTTHWLWQDFPGLFEQSAEKVAGQLLHKLAKQEDDATVLVVKGAHARADKPRPELEQARLTIRLLQEELVETNRGLVALTLELEKRVEARAAELRAAQEELVKTNSELMQLTLELEDRVAERTTQLQRKDEEVKTMSQQLWQTAKLATMGELAASIAHELNNPLQTISLRIESLLAETSAQDSNQHTLGIIQQELDRMTNLVANLLQFSRRGTTQLSTLNVSEEIGKTLELIHYHLRNHNIRVEQQFTSDALLIHADRQQLRQLFLNLFTNASDAMPEGGTLSIRAGFSEDKAASGSQNQVVIEIADTGTGISPENLPRLGEPFFTTKSIGKGTGLGLAICRRIVLDHKGSLDFSSEVNQGTTIRVTLPVQADGIGGIEEES